MRYTTSQLCNIKSRVFAKISSEFDKAIDNEEVDEFLEKYGIIFEEEYIPVNTRTMRILVFGALAGRVSDYSNAAKKMGISPDNIVFENDYEKLTNYDSERLRNSFDYSDIIMACNPHKIKNLDGYNSFTSKIRAEQSQYPRLIESPDSHGQKLSISGFKCSLYKTRYFENLTE